ncbi:RDD family protein [Gordonia sp. zg691]|uniref:RDD family protein n=1 Tax=Gordonia jinghuaiqii TaxID=2758710 RepID=A0A7D7LRQ2_9ACTN|nr:RDD family protein [Gordonia jinghuaiqii]MBD0862809.1 RDD family protein [Gordonia jinghuaiqii]MCR5979058.1 RDD family protein [Gordonia jinghuaiqii]QMT01620.1 RDD family protein [Gordonia jinghuaiqii]
MSPPPPPRPPGFPGGAPPSAWGTGASATVGVGRDDLVSGEAVALALPPAHLGYRILSGAIDVVLGVALWLFLWWLSYKVAIDVNQAWRGSINTLLPIVSVVALPTVVETLTRGKTVGHLVVGLRTLRDDAGPTGFRHSVTRALVGFIELYACLGLPALISAAISRKNKRLGDLLAGTYVIRDRHRIVEQYPIEMPPQLEAWAVSADIAALPDHLAVVIRQFLHGRHDMKPEPRAFAARRIVFDVAPFVAPAPPPGAPFEDVLSAIMAERRRRDTARLAREARLRERLLR